MKAGQLSIHSENILPIIKKWLYSEKDIFVRELAANASDAIQKLTLLANRGDATAPQEPRIDIAIDAAQKTLTFSDTGLGLTAEEAEKFLSQIAFSGAEEFIKTYELHDTFIGHFGLGFFSAFMVADSVDVVSKSYTNSEAIDWHSDGSTNYTINPATREKVGTDVILHINAENEEYLDEHRLRRILQRFCGFFPHPVFLNGTRINEHEPLWQKRPSECSEEEYRSFYSVLYPFEEPPLFWVHVNVDYPFHVKGILYFPRINPEIELRKEHIKLYSNRVFVSDDCKDILPDYLSLLRGVLDSPDIPLNVSRSHLQVDATVRQLAQHIVKKVADALFSLFKADRKHFEEAWEAIEIVLKLGMLSDDKFYQRAKEWLIWKTTDGEYKTTAEVSVDKNEKKAIVYCEPGSESSPLVAAYRAKNIPVIIASCSLDHPLMSRLERDDYSFKRIDAALESSLVDTQREKTILDASGRSEAAHIEDFFRTALNDQSITVEAKSLDAPIPAILTMEEEERRFRDYMARMGERGKSIQMKPKSSLIINTNSSLVQAAMKMQETKPELAQQLAVQIYDLTRLSHKELSHDDIHKFAARSSKLLEELTATLSA